MKKTPPHAIVLGCGRSGTSIFGELFNHLPIYHYHSEPAFDELLNFDFSQPIAVKVPRESAGYPPPAGLSFPLNVLTNKVGTPLQFFWIVRHPLDTICSLKIGISKNWGHHPQPVDWQDWLSEPLLKQCAYHWNYINTVGYEQVKHLVKLKHFEDLILEPLSFASTICKDLEIDPESVGEALSEWAIRVQNTNNKNFVEAQTSRAYSTNDHKVKVGRWQENMTREEVDLVWPMIKNTALKFGYDITLPNQFR